MGRADGAGVALWSSACGLGVGGCVLGVTAMCVASEASQRSNREEACNGPHACSLQSPGTHTALDDAAAGTARVVLSALTTPARTLMQHGSRVAAPGSTHRRMARAHAAAAADATVAAAAARRVRRDTPHVRTDVRTHHERAVGDGGPEGLLHVQQLLHPRQVKHSVVVEAVKVRGRQQVGL